MVHKVNSPRTDAIMPQGTGSVQDCNFSIANALEIQQSCTKPSMYSSRQYLWGGFPWGLMYFVIMPYKVFGIARYSANKTYIYVYHTGLPVHYPSLMWPNLSESSNISVRDLLTLQMCQDPNKIAIILKMASYFYFVKQYFVLWLKISNYWSHCQSFLKSFLWAQD